MRGKKKTHEEFMNDFKIKGNQNIVILGRYINSKTKILVKCAIDEYEWEVLPGELLKGCGCPVCCSRVFVSEINSVAAKRPDLLQYFENQNDAYSVTCSSKKKVNLICPDCGTLKNMTVDELTHYKFSCPVCGDGISYPNKFIRQVMIQLKEHIDCLDYEWKPQWAEEKVYDVYFYVMGKHYVIEMQGNQHYSSAWYTNRLDEIVDVDNRKLKMAKDHNVTPIVIDARISKPNFIIKNIQNSILSEIFNLSVIDWDACDKGATKNIAKQICDSFNKNPYIRFNDLAEQHGVSRHTVRKYLKKGNKFGWCEYDSKISFEKNAIYNGTSVSVFDKNNQLLNTYYSINKCRTELSKQYNCNFRWDGIRDACEGKLDSYRGLFFEYA